MATCIDSINASTTFDLIDKNIDYNFNLSPVQNKIFALDSESNQTFYFSVAITSSSIVPDVFMTILNNNLDVVRTSRISTNTIVSVDLQTGEYYVCFRVFNGSFSIRLNVDFIRFSRNVTFDVGVYHGEQLQGSIKGTKVPVPCNQPLKYTLEYGELPTGLSISQTGFISGVIPIIDTEELTSTPSANLFHKTNGVYVPIGVRYDFYIRLSLLNDLSVFVIKKFCITVVNDWSLTKDIIDLIATNEEQGLIEYVKQEIPKSLCPPCDNEDSPISIVYDVKTNLIENNQQLDFVKYAVENENELLNGLLLNDVNFTPSKDEYVTIPIDVDTKTHIANNIDFYVGVGHDLITLTKFLEGLYEYTLNDGLLHIIVNDSIDINDPLYKFVELNNQELRDEAMYVNVSYGEQISFILEV